MHQVGIGEFQLVDCDWGKKYNFKNDFTCEQKPWHSSIDTNYCIVNLVFIEGKSLVCS